MATRTSTRTTSRRAPRRPAHVVVDRTAARTGEQRSREEGGPRDLAFYDCACGHGFSGAVSTHVACPHCGADQAW